MEKDHALNQLQNNLEFHLEDYHPCFQNETSDGHELGRAYIHGLFKTEAGKRNMERMNEELELSGAGYQRIQQFITDSTWSADNLIRQIARDTSDLYANAINLRLSGSACSSGGNPEVSRVSSYAERSGPV